MKKNFLTGLVLLLPVALTFLVIGFLIDVLTNPFLGIMKSLLHHYHLLDAPFFIFSGEQVLVFWSRLFILLFLSGIILLTGFVTHILFLDYVISLANKLIHRIPVINQIYKAFQDGVNAVFKREKDSKIHVVIVPYPAQHSYCLGIMANDHFSTNSDLFYQDKASVCVIGSPNPTLGFNILYKKDQIILLDMSVEEALKYIVSCGASQTQLKPLSLNL